MSSCRRCLSSRSAFFFSSRRRHTRWNCDWSSDVCSSDLQARMPTPVRGVMVSDVTPGGPADEKLTTNDVITEVLYPLPRRAINSPADLQNVLKGLKNGDYISLSVFNLAERTHAPRIVNIQLGR